MKKFKLPLLLIVSFFISLKTARAQERDLVKIAANIVAEADILYKSEWASWNGTDIFSEKCKTRRTLAGGYISYDTGKGLTNVFFSKDAEPKILSTISFEYGFNPQKYTLDTADRKFTKQEKELYIIRQAVIADMYKDTIYKNYKNASLNPVPVISNRERKVYVLTGPDISGVVIFGNDYLIKFDKNNNITSKKTLHKNIIPANYTKAGSSGKELQVASMHSHLPETGGFITATDICTLRLYVMSKNYVSIWDCKKNILAIMTMEAWKRIGEHQNALKN
jgi:hypothetical protein